MYGYFEGILAFYSHLKEGLGLSKECLMVLVLLDAFPLYIFIFC